MQSLFGRLTLWAVVTALVCLVGVTLTDNLRSFSTSREDFLSRFLQFQVVEARHAYEDDGRPGLQSFVAQLRSHFPGTYALLDRNGRDLLTGEDRSGEVHRSELPRQWRSGRDKVRIVWPDADRRYFLAVEAVFPVGPPQTVPYSLWLLLAGLGFCLIPAYQIASPLRALSQTVEKFGIGQLDARVDLRRSRLEGSGEIGKLGAAFNVMADRIQTLLNAERRLLLDVSHELRSPLARLKFAVQLARTSPDRQHSLNRIERDIDRLTVLVSELLQVTRAENDPHTLASAPVHLNALLAEVVEAGSFEVQARRCRVRMMAEQDVWLDGDRELLHRAIENVLRNAIRFAPDGSEIEVTLTRRAAGEAAITIRDHGPGVPEPSIPSLFQPFFRVEADRNRMYGGGFGLGLSIAERAVSAHGGSIRASNANPGLMVEMILPAKAVRAPEPDAGEQTSDQPALARAAGAK